MAQNKHPESGAVCRHAAQNCSGISGVPSFAAHAERPVPERHIRCKNPQMATLATVWSEMTIGKKALSS
jgi:hypothetical protein